MSRNTSRNLVLFEVVGACDLPSASTQTMVKARQQANPSKGPGLVSWPEIGVSGFEGWPEGVPDLLAGAD